MEARRRIPLPLDMESLTKKSKKQLEQDEGKKDNEKECRTLHRFSVNQVGNDLAWKISIFILIQFWILHHYNLAIEYSSTLTDGDEWMTKIREWKNNNTVPGFITPFNNPAPPKHIGPCKGLTYKRGSAFHRPIWMASFPGSGEPLFQDLVHAFTGGILSGSNYVKQDWPYMNCLDVNVATCKTHWPVLPHHPPFAYDESAYDKRAILVMRNPMSVFFQRMVHTWKQSRPGSKSPSSELPLESEWNNWIQKNWKNQIQQYQTFLTAWTIQNFTATEKRYMPKVVLVIAYEQMITDQRGLIWAQRLADVLRMGKNRVILSNHVSCLWKHSVLSNMDPLSKNITTYSPKYTNEQMGSMIKMMDDLIMQTRDQVEVNRILQFYRYKMVKT